MAELWDGTRQRAVHCSSAVPENVTANVVLDWATVTSGSNSLSRYMRLDARANSVSVRVPIAPGVAHNGKKLKITVHPDDSSSSNFRGVVFTGGNPIERGTLTSSNIYMLDRRSGHIVLEVVNGVVRINTGASFNADPPTPGNTELLAILNGWTTGATWVIAPDNANEAFVQFLANGAFNPTRALNAQLLALAGAASPGGGVSSVTYPDGSNAGSLTIRTAASLFAIPAGSHAVTIGQGGAPVNGSTNRNGLPGNPTSLGALLTVAGGLASNQAAGTGQSTAQVGTVLTIDGVVTNRTQAASVPGSPNFLGGGGSGAGGNGSGTAAGIYHTHNITGVNVNYAAGGAGVSAGVEGTSYVPPAGRQGTAPLANRGSGASRATGSGNSNTEAGGSGLLILRANLLSAIGL